MADNAPVAIVRCRVQAATAHTPTMHTTAVALVAAVTLDGVHVLAAHARLIGTALEVVNPARRVCATIRLDGAALAVLVESTQHPRGHLDVRVCRHRRRALLCAALGAVSLQKCASQRAGPTGMGRHDL
jgi:hypothetical protein